MRKKLVVGNWKMNGSLARNEALLAGLKANVSGERVDVVVCPPYPYLAQAASMLDGTAAEVGAQSLSAVSEGAHTGEVSAGMLLDVGCRWVIVGHSERRSLYGETDEAVAAKTLAAIEAGLVPMLCVGETLLEREAGAAEQIVCVQLDAVVKAVGVERAAELVVAYEPVWAIGTGKTATPEQAQAMHACIRSHLARLGVAVDGVRILYGGSVTAANAAALFAQRDIDGALVGGASLQIDGFSAICAAAAAF